MTLLPPRSRCWTSRSNVPGRRAGRLLVEERIGKLDRRQVDPPPVEDELVLGEVEDGSLADQELRGDQHDGRPSVDDGLKSSTAAQ
jgi:hypothetical protein